jgi:hypothetical protein
VQSVVNSACIAFCGSVLLCGHRIPRFDVDAIIRVNLFNLWLIQALNYGQLFQ